MGIPGFPGIYKYYYKKTISLYNLKKFNFFLLTFILILKKKIVNKSTIFCKKLQNNKMYFS